MTVQGTVFLTAFGVLACAIAALSGMWTHVALCVVLLTVVCTLKGCGREGN